MRIGLYGTPSYSDTNKIVKIFTLIRSQNGSFATINSAGNDTGADYLVKKLALELNYTFKEFNPSYTGKRMYSAMDESYYGKGYHYSHLVDRYKHLIYNSDYICVFIEKGIKPPKDLQFSLDFAVKKNKKIVIIN